MSNIVSLQDSYEECRQLNKHYGTFFYHAINLFPKKDQPHVHALCAYMRILDELVDSPNEGITKTKQEQAIKNFAQILLDELAASYSPHPYRQAIVHTAKFHDIPEQHFKRLASSKIKDLQTKRYTSYTDLQKHIDNTSGLLAEMLTESIGYKREQAFRHAKNLARSGHLIRTICNISSDFTLHDRLYIPQRELKKQKATIQAVKKETMTPELKSVIAVLLEKAEKELTLFEKGLKHFPDTSHKALHTTTQIYHGLIESIKKLDYDVFTRRPDVNWAHRLRCALPF